MFTLIRRSWWFNDVLVFVDNYMKNRRNDSESVRLNQRFRLGVRLKKSECLPFNSIADAGREKWRKITMSTNKVVKTKAVRPLRGRNIHRESRYKHTSLSLSFSPTVSYSHSPFTLSTFLFSTILLFDICLSLTLQCKPPSIWAVLTIWCQFGNCVAIILPPDNIWQHRSENNEVTSLDRSFLFRHSVPSLDPKSG